MGSHIVSTLNALNLYMLA